MIPGLHPSAGCGWVLFPPLTRRRGKQETCIPRPQARQRRRGRGPIGRLTRCALAIALSTLATAAHAATVTVAVAANFREPLDALVPLFNNATGYEATISAGSTGQLYAQIVNGAPYDVFLAADEARPARLVAERHGVEGSRFTYATGRLTLWSADPARVGPDGAATLKAGNFRILSIANPRTAPYGAAARQVLERLDLWDTLAPRVAQAQNIGQAFAVVASGNAELGLVALSSVLSPRNRTPGSRWDVPQDLHDPIRQDAVLLAHGAENAAARAFLDFLRSDGARAVITAYGYAVAE